MRYTGVMPWLILLALSCSRPPIVEPEPPLEPTWRVASADVTEGPFTNRLSEASSPYLRQHGHNPVDWYPWGEEALAEAARRDVPVFLSIGYAACHWCHVMEEESFEDPVLAAYLNDHFVAVKVDREERPDIDALYMDAVHALNGRGGWPASIWLTPKGEPFYAGTYFPPVGRSGRPGFRDVLESITQAWLERRAEVQGTADELVAVFERRQGATLGTPPEDVLEPFVRQTIAAWNPGTRGWGSKQFPMSPRQQALVDAVVLLGDADAKRVVEQTLWTMDRGGLHDQLAGGFHRYTVDEHWQIPHFEKMLYDNGQLVGLYAAASVVLDEPRFAQVAAGTAEFMMRDLRDPQTGLFASSLDADTAGEEGTTYLWTPSQVRQALGDEAEAVIGTYAITPSGNFEGQTVLTRPTGSPPADALRHQLLSVRQDREQPRLDDKAVVSYNGLAATGLARAGRLAQRSDWVDAAAGAMRAVLASRDDAGRLPRTVGGDAPVGVLEDYTATTLALLELHTATGDPLWLGEAESVYGIMDSVFWDHERHVWRHSADADLLVSRVDVTDGPEPSGVSQALRATRWLTALGSARVPADRLSQAFSGTSRWLERAPASVPSLAVSHALAQQPAMTVVVAATTVSEASPFVHVYNQQWRPNATLMVHTSGSLTAGFSLSEGKTPAEDSARAFLCFDGACQQPVTEPAALAAQLQASTAP